MNINKKNNYFPHLRIRRARVSEEGDSLAQTSLKQRQNVRKDGVDVVAIAVHQLTQKIQFLTAGLELHQLTQPVRSPNMHSTDQRSWGTII